MSRAKTPRRKDFHHDMKKKDGGKTFNISTPPLRQFPLLCVLASLREFPLLSGLLSENLSLSEGKSFFKIGKSGPNSALIAEE